VFEVIACAAAAAYAASLRHPGAVFEVPSGALIRPFGTRHCLYCRRAYEGKVPRTCDGCGASEYTPAGFMIEAARRRL
jgi:hypothetical protein